MVRTSRCFGGISFQLGGPNALMGVERFRRILPFADFFFAQFQLLFHCEIFCRSKGERRGGLGRLANFQNHFQEVSHGGPGDRIGQTEAGYGEDIG
jgi:hypothetical protein